MVSGFVAALCIIIIEYGDPHLFFMFFFQISMNARKSSLVTPTPTAPTLQAPTSVTARKGSRETAPTVKVRLNCWFDFQIRLWNGSRFCECIGLRKNSLAVPSFRNESIIVTQSRILILFKFSTALFLFFQISMNARLSSLVTPKPNAPILLAHLSVCARQDTQGTAVTAQVGIWQRKAQNNKPTERRIQTINSNQETRNQPPNSTRNWREVSEVCGGP